MTGAGCRNSLTPTVDDVSKIRALTMCPATFRMAFSLRCAGRGWSAIYYGVLRQSYFLALVDGGFSSVGRNCNLCQIIMFSDLECDYINPIDLCNKLNQVSLSALCTTGGIDVHIQFVLPEMIFHAFLTTLFLLSGQWTALILNAPLVAFNVQKCVIDNGAADAFQARHFHAYRLLQDNEQKSHVRCH